MQVLIQIFKKISKGTKINTDTNFLIGQFDAARVYSLEHFVNAVDVILRFFLSKNRCVDYRVIKTKCIGAIPRFVCLF